MKKKNKNKIIKKLLENHKKWMEEEPKKDTLKDKLLKALLPPEEISEIDEFFKSFTMPLIRATFPSNPINDLVSVQPMTKEELEK